MLAIFLLFAASLPDIEVGANFTRPAQVAGPWEALVAPNEIAGFSLHIVAGADEKVRSVRIDTYVRKDGKTSNTYWDTGSKGTFSLRTGLLHFQQVRSNLGGFDVTLDLTYDPVELVWKGRFNDPYFSGEVTLRRPSLTNLSAPAGTWRIYSSVTSGPLQRVVNFGCLNIGIGQDDALVLWSEDHNLFLGGSEPQSTFGDSYGVVYDDSHAVSYGREWSFTEGSSLWSNRITGTLSDDGSSFGGYYSDHQGNGIITPSHPRRVFAWTRMLNLECRP